MPDVNKANGKQDDTDKLVERRVAEELRRRGVDDAKAKLSDEQKALCTIIADEVAQKLKAEKVAAPSSPEETKPEPEPDFGFLTESAAHKAWRVAEEKRTGKKVKNRPMLAKLGE